MLGCMWQRLDLVNIVLVTLALDRDRNDELTQLEDLDRVATLGNGVEVRRVELRERLIQLLLDIAGHQIVKLLEVVVFVHPVVAHLGRTDQFEPFRVSIQSVVAMLWCERAMHSSYLVPKKSEVDLHIGGDFEKDYPIRQIRDMLALS